jgi:integrase
VSRPATPLTDPISSAYIAWCIAERVPANTVRRRRTVLRSVGNAGVATRDEIEQWWASRRHLKATSRANDLAVLRSFYTWCAVWEHRDDNPTVRLRPPRQSSGAPKPTTRAELDAILEHVGAMPPDTGGPLRRAVLLGAWAGLRREEAARLRWTDIDSDTRRALVTGKGGKTRSVTFSAKLLAEIGPDTGGNVVTGKMTAWSPDTLGRKVNGAIAAAGVDGTFHKLRHRYGSVAYQRTKDPKALAEQMGHASVSTTMTFYAAAADDAAQLIADAVSDDD